MKNSLLILILFITVNVMSQENYNNIVFKFNAKSEFTNQFKNRTLEKNYEFKIIGIVTDKQAISLKNSISNYRGVVSFTVSNLNSNGERTAQLKLYKYADHWKYYEYLFSKNGINRIMLGHREYLPSELEK